MSANFDSTHPDEVKLDAAGLLAQRNELFPNSDQTKLEVHQLVLLKLVAYIDSLPASLRWTEAYCTLQVSCAVGLCSHEILERRAQYSRRVLSVIKC